jgi:tRNA(fMet)-specific endonuclease VapC
LDQIDQLVNTGVVIPCDEVTGYWYGIVKDILRRKGHPIPENDIWIAALAIQYGLSLATRDKHFLIIENLKVEMW